MNDIPTQLLRPADVQARTTLDRRTILRKVKDGTFPEPVRLNPGRIAWREADVEAFIASCGAARSGEA